MTRHGRFLALVLTGFALFAACGGDPDPATTEPGSEPVRGGTLVVGVRSDVATWNEYLNPDAQTLRVLRRLYLPLASVGLDGDADGAAPQLAASWSVDPAARTIDFTLREATWSDGTPVRADDVVFTWRAQIADAVGWASAGNKRSIDSVEAVGPRTVRFRFSRTYPTMFADAVDGGIVPEHVFANVPFEDWTTHDWSSVDVVSGPYRLTEHVTGQRVRLGRNPRYFLADDVRLDEVVFLVVPDDTARLQQLRSGDLDFVDGVPQDAAARLADTPGIEVRGYRLPNYDYIGWNGRRPPLDDPAVRRALSMAIDREALVETLLFGYGTVANGPVPSAHPAHAPSVEPVPYDPAAARRALTAAGVDRLELTLLTNTGNRIRADAALRIQAQLAEVGVDVELRTVEMGALRRAVGSGDYDAYLGGWNFSGKVELTALFHSTAGMNLVAFSDPGVDAILDRLEAAEDGAAYAAAAAELQDALRELQPYTFLFEKERVAAWRDRVRGVTLPDSFDTYAALESFWRVDAGE